MNRRVFAILAIVLFCRPAFPQGDNGDVSVVVRSTDESALPKIQIDFEVKRADGSPLLDAKQADFRVMEYDVECPILAFDAPLTKQTRPTTIVLVLDHSGSMEDNIDELKRAVGSFLDAMPEGSRVAIIAFGSTLDLICPFTTDRASARWAVNQIEVAGGTRYYDAVDAALQLIAGEKGRRAVLAMTDGFDTESRIESVAPLIASAREIGVPVHTLGLGMDDANAAVLNPGFIVTQETKDEIRRLQLEALETLATETRGQYFPAKNAGQLQAIYEELARGLKDSYSLTYQSDRTLPDGTLRPIRVFYKQQKEAAGKTAVYVRGMVVPKRGWSWLFLLLVGGMAALAALPGRLRVRS
jgi:VWFA-related protein